MLIREADSCAWDHTAPTGQSQDPSTGLSVSSTLNTVPSIVLNIWHCDRQRSVPVLGGLRSGMAGGQKLNLNTNEHMIMS